MTRFCPSCHKTILHGSLTTQIMSDDYHSSCIHCFRCGQNLWQKGFVKRSDGKLACEEGMCAMGSASTEVVPPIVPVVESSPRKANQNANSFSINNQFQDMDTENKINGKTVTAVPQATQSVPPQTTIIGTLLPNPKYSKYFKDTTDKDKESVKNGKTNNAVHSYNMSKNMNGNKKNQNILGKVNKHF